MTDIDEILDIRKMIGVCQQSDIHFEDLTVEENLSVFASLKGISKTCKELEVRHHVVTVDLLSGLFDLISKLILFTILSKFMKLGEETSHRPTRPPE